MSDKLLEHITRLHQAIQRGFDAQDDMRRGLDIGDTVALEEYNWKYHLLREQQKARLDQLLRLSAKYMRNKRD